MNDIQVKNLIKQAFDTLQYAYVPYSNFKVAAALLTKENEIYTGCNIENAAYSPSNCAERTAFFKAVSEGKRNFKAICIVNEDAEGAHNFCPPCGVCRQVMAEFCASDFVVILARSMEEYRSYLLEDLLPQSFTLKN